MSAAKVDLETPEDTAALAEWHAIHTHDEAIELYAAGMSASFSEPQTPAENVRVAAIDTILAEKFGEEGLYSIKKQAVKRLF